MKFKLLGHGANDLYWFILPLVLPALLTRYNLSYAQAGGILTTYLAVTAIGSFIIGKLSDRFSRKRILSLGFFLASFGLISSGFASSLSVFILLISITAVGVSTFHPVMYAVIDENYPENKGRVMGMYEGVGTGAILLMYLINGYLIRWIGIRGVLILTAVPGLIMGLIYQLTPAIPPRIKNTEIRAEKAGKTGKKEILTFNLFLISVILRVVSVTAILNFLPTIFVKFFGFGENIAAYGTAFYFAGGIIGAILVGRISDRINSLIIIITGTALIIPFLLIMSFNLPLWIYLIAITLFGSFSSSCLINQNLMLTRLGSHLGRGEVFGILMGVMTITASLSPILFGMGIDYAGFNKALILLTIPLMLSLILLTVLLKMDIRNKVNAGNYSNSL
jgi:MFS transporter, FSR family, fosmidomycin resistance protein